MMIKRSNFIAIAMVLAGFCTSATAQVEDKGRTCGSAELHENSMQNDPEYAARYIKRQAELDAYLKEMEKHPKLERAVRTIPVVIHLVDGSLTDTQVQAEIDVLTEAYRGLNSDISKTPSYFTSSIGDPQIEFCLATKDPSGNATTGITRNNSCEGGAWNRRNYLNIWVCSIGGGSLGYSHNLANGYNGVTVIGYQYFSPTGSGNYGLGRTTVHEVGHYLGLKHIWGDASCGSDGVSDTPTQSSSSFGCPGKTVSCSNGPNGNMNMNYMDYSNDPCMYMFTNGQAARMNGVLDSYGQGFFSNPSCSNDRPPSADFSASITSGCGSLAVNFTDGSGGSPTSWSWDFGDGFNSSLQNPSHTYSSAGTYNVKMTATNAFGNNTQTKNSYISVGTGGTYPPVNGGPADNTFGTGAYFTSNDIRGLFFDALKPIVIESVKVYANTAGSRTIEVLTGSATGPVLASRIINIPAGESRIMLNIQVAVGNQYFLKVTGATVDLYRNADGSAWPYAVSDLVSITGSDASVGYYYYFYDWAVREDGCDGTIGISEPSSHPIRIFPNPATDILSINFGSNQGNASVEIYSVLGNLVYKKNLGVLNKKRNQHAVDLNTIPSGSYVVKIMAGDKVHTKRLIKTGL